MRREFIDPFFTALGWDVDNRAGYAEAYKDVIHEDAIRIGAATKAPDYCFRIGGTRKFFIEAKKPSIDIKGDPHPAFQLRRYAWSAKLPLSILTDFEEFAVYDCRTRPKKNDRASTARIKYINYAEYPDRWDEIESIFSHDAILKGSFDKYAQSAKRKKGTAEVDAAFLAEIERWREILAKNIAQRNPVLTNRQLNFAVQKTIDRIIFLRIAEDRGIEHYGELLALCNGRDVYQRLLSLFQKADDRYNSGLFHFQQEKERPEVPDELTPGLTIDDAVFKDIFKTLYYPDSPYEFSVLPAEILGHVYEQFLGKVITLTPAHRAKIEEKPEVKKAGGVYYTPAYIVDHIVENTVAKLLASRTVKHFKTRPPRMDSPLTVCDPACGSGSFLLGAYQHLLDWHLKHYTKNNPIQWLKSANPPITEATTALAGSHTNYKLTVAERKRILLQHIHGVDIDPQAVEVTKLSLLLKVLEGEKSEMLFATQRALPDLANNIKCGNSLIAPDFYQNQQLALFDEEQRARINAFDWKQEFPQIFNTRNLGFDAVIGNPPYVDVKMLGADIKSDLGRRYRSASRRFDLFVPFIEKGLQLLSGPGLLGFIVPSMFMYREYGADLRALIAECAHLVNLVDFGTNQVFSNAMNYVCIAVMSTRPTDADVHVTCFRSCGLPPSALKEALDATPESGVLHFKLPQATFAVAHPWSVYSDEESSTIEKLKSHGEPLASFVQYASEGIHSGKDLVFYLSVAKARTMQLESPPVYPLAKGKDVHRYEYVDPAVLPNVVIYPYDTNSRNVISQAELARKAPNTFSYLQSAREHLKGRAYFDKSNKLWYELWCPRDPLLYEAPKIIGPEIACRGEFTLAESPLFFNNKLKGIVLKNTITESRKYILGLLNSSPLVYFHRLMAPPKGNNFFEVKTRVLSQLPIRKIDFTDPTDKSRHDKMVSLVQTMLDLNKALQNAKTPDEKTALQRQITATDNQIDQLVYELYNLTEEEIRIVEAATR